MYIDRFFRPSLLFRHSLRPILLFIGYSSIVTTLYYYFEWPWLSVPWVPMTLLAIALAFYVGFKNNSAYDRTCEARMIWGGIVNSSRSWGAMVTGFVTNEFATEKLADRALHELHKRLIYRHIA
jgi:putative membrane protein